MSQTIAPEISVIQKISEVIIHERNVEKLLKNVLGILDSEMGMLRGTFALLHGDELKIEASRGLGEKERAHGHYRLGEGITGSVAKSGHAEVVPGGVRRRARRVEVLVEPLGIVEGVRGRERQVADERGVFDE